MSTLAFHTVVLDSGPDHNFGKSTNAARYDYNHATATVSDSHNISSVRDNATGRLYFFFSYPFAELHFNEYSSGCHDNTRAGGALVVYHTYRGSVQDTGSTRNSTAHAYVSESYMANGGSPTLIDGVTGTGTFMGDHY